MRFRTEFSIAPWPRPLERSEELLSLGSCFSERIAHRLREALFRVTINPSGVLFNPHSVAHTLELYRDHRVLRSEELQQGNGLYFHYDFHGEMSHPNREVALQRCNAALEQGHQALMRADSVMLTFGTAWVYRLREGGEVVANCHKQPASLFDKQLLGVEEIVARWQPLITGILRDKRLIFTLSPVRHLGDGAAENSLSKATLRLAIETLQRLHPESYYFPAYELLLDDLRDYRFYGEDLVHPSTEAERYIWERFREVALSDAERDCVARIERLQRARSHRPLHPETEQAQQFRQRTEAQIAELEAKFGITFPKI